MTSTDFFRQYQQGVRAPKVSIIGFKSLCSNPFAQGSPERNRLRERLVERCRLSQKINQQSADLLRPLLLHPVPGVVDQVFAL